MEAFGSDIADSLDAAGVTSHFASFNGECSNQEIERVLNILRQNPLDYVTGVGGGKTLDTAKAVAWKAGVPCAVVPTIASTDAPTAAASIVYTPTGEFAEVLIYPTNPALVLVDTEIISRAPARFLQAGIGDALATKFEARACLRSGARTVAGGRPTQAALAIAELCYDVVVTWGEQAVEDVRQKRVTEAVEKVVEANTLLSGVGFESGGLAAAHAIHNGLTALATTHDYYHGEKVAFSTVAHLVLEGNHTAARQVAAFCEKIGLPVHLGALSVDATDRANLELVAQKACAPGESIHNMPFPIIPEQVLEAILVAHQIGLDIASPTQGTIDLV
jgi:glycerol dehydrogenase